MPADRNFRILTPHRPDKSKAHGVISRPRKTANGNPAPLVLTSNDLINLLRLDDQGPKNGEATLKYYRDRGLLKGIRLGKKIRYTLPDVLVFLEKQMEFTNQRNTG